MVKKVATLFMIVICLFAFSHPQNIYAHAGNLDKLGGHFAVKEKKYHFHKKSSLLAKAKTKQEVVNLINKYNDNKVKFKITVNSVDWASYSAKYYTSNKNKPGKTFKQMYGFVPK